MLLLNILGVATVLSTLVSGLPVAAPQDHAVSLHLKRTPPPVPLDKAVIDTRSPVLNTVSQEQHDAALTKFSKRADNAVVDADLEKREPEANPEFRTKVGMAMEAAKDAIKLTTQAGKQAGIAAKYEIKSGAKDGKVMGKKLAAAGKEKMRVGKIKAVNAGKAAKDAFKTAAKDGKQMAKTQAAAGKEKMKVGMEKAKEKTTKWFSPASQKKADPPTTNGVTAALSEPHLQPITKREAAPEPAKTLGEMRNTVSNFGAATKKAAKEGQLLKFVGGLGKELGMIAKSKAKKISGKKAGPPGPNGAVRGAMMNPHMKPIPYIKREALPEEQKVEFNTKTSLVKDHTYSKREAAPESALQKRSLPQSGSEWTRHDASAVKHELGKAATLTKIEAGKKKLKEKTEKWVANKLKKKFGEENEKLSLHRDTHKREASPEPVLTVDSLKAVTMPIWKGAVSLKQKIKAKIAYTLDAPFRRETERFKKEMAANRLDRQAILERIGELNRIWEQKLMSATPKREAAPEPGRTLDSLKTITQPIVNSVVFSGRKIADKVKQKKAAHKKKKEERTRYEEDLHWLRTHGWKGEYKLQTVA